MYKMFFSSKSNVYFNAVSISGQLRLSRSAPIYLFNVILTIHILSALRCRLERKSCFINSNIYYSNTIYKFCDIFMSSFSAFICSTYHCALLVITLLNCFFYFFFWRLMRFLFFCL